MTLEGVKLLLTEVIKSLFLNKQTLDKLSEDDKGTLFYKGSALSTSAIVSEEENNAIQKREDGSIFVEDTTEDVQKLKEDVSNIPKYQKYINTELNHAFCKLNSNYTPVLNNFVPFVVKNGNIVSTNEGLFQLKARKTYSIHAVLSYVDTSKNTYANIGYDIFDYTNNKSIQILMPYNEGANFEQSDDVMCHYTPKSDCEIGLKVTSIYANDIIDPNRSTMCIQEIGRETVIDPVDYANEDKGIEDTPVGHIIAHMGTTAPKHYLACDGTVYNIADYPYLSQHIQDNFGVVNYFGGDGETTFAVPDLRERFLKGSENVGINQEAGLPNITGTISMHGSGTATVLQSASGAFKGNTARNQYGASTPKSGASSYDNFTLNANTSSSVYGKSTTVTPLNTSVLYCIKYEPTYFIVRQNTNYMQLNLYSEEERIVGCWINGKPIYQKTIVTTVPKVETDGVYVNNSIDLSEMNIDTITKYEGFITNNITILAIPSINAQFNGCVTYWYNVENKLLYISNTLKVYNDRTIYLTLQYTKITNEENSFNKDMINDFVINKETPDDSTEEEIQNIISEMLEDIFAEEEMQANTPTVIPELYPEMDDTPTVIPEIYDEPETPNEGEEEPEQNELEVTESEEVIEPVVPEEPVTIPEEGEIEQ